MAKKKGKMPAALKAYWAKMRAGKSASKSGRKAKTRTVYKTRTRTNTVVVRRRGGRSSAGFAIVPSLRGIASTQTAKVVGGVAVGMLASNQLPAMAASLPQSPEWLRGKWGQLGLKVGVAVVGGMVLARVHRQSVGPFVAGALAEPAVGWLRTVIAQARAKQAGVQGLAALAQGRAA